MNTYYDSKGNKYTTSQIERRIKKSALLLLDTQLLNYGYNFCERCKSNDCKPLDVSHNISRKFAKEHSIVEVLWDLSNLEIIGRSCHQKKDKLNLNYEN